MVELGRIAAIWRYPIKSLAAEALSQAALEQHGIPGDRHRALFVESGHARIGKTYRGKENNLLHTVSHSGDASRIARERGVSVQDRVAGAYPYFDDAPISLVFDRWIAEIASALGMPLDPLRWRPNFYAVASASFEWTEEQLIGRTIEAGQAALQVRSTIKRCVTPTYDIPTGKPAPEVLEYIATHRNNVFGVYCDVAIPGSVKVQDMLRI